MRYSEPTHSTGRTRIGGEQHDETPGMDFLDWVDARRNGGMNVDALRDSTEDVTRLRDGLNDLARIMALPALWAGGDPPQIVGTLLDALLGMLGLAFVFARVNDPEGGPPVEMVRVAESLGATGGTRQINAALDAFVPKWPAPARMCIGEVDLSVASARLGLQGEIGIIVAGSSRP
jgi:hypothetical protein